MFIIMIVAIIGLVFFLIGCTTETVWMRFVGFVILVLFVCGIFGYCAGVTLPEWQCKQKAEAMGVECKFDLFAGCLVKYHGTWYPIGSIRAFE